MQCAECGAELVGQSAFCHQCGANQTSGAKNDGAGVPREEATASQDHSGGSRHNPAADRFAEATRAKRDDVADDAEQSLWTGGYSGKAMYGTWLAASGVMIGAVIVGILVGGPVGLGIGLLIGVVFFLVGGAVLAARKLGVHYELTSQRFIHKSGILRRVTDRIEVIDMDDVTYVQGIVQRMLGVGTIKISSSDRSHPELILQGIDDVQRIAGLIDDVRRRERRKRGIHIESI